MTTFLLWALLNILTLKVSPASCFSPCPVRVTISIEDATEADWVDLAIEGTGVASESHRSQINMSHGRRTYEIHLTLRGEGEFEVYAGLYRRSTWRASARQIVILAGGQE